MELKEQKQNDFIQLDTKCLNCNNGNQAEKKMIFDLFKIACIKYRPSDISGIETNLGTKVTLSRFKTL
jgi:hypothetical protein